MRNVFSVSVVAVAALVLLETGAEAGQHITVRVGQTAIVGEVLKYDDNGFTILDRQLSVPVTLTWNALSPREERRVRRILRRKGAAGALQAGEDVSVPTMDGLRVTLKTGRVLIGRELADMSDDASLFIRTARAPLFEILRSAIDKVETVKIPVTEIYPPRELYQRKLAEMRPRTARDHYELASYCKRVKLYDKARQHLQLCAVLDEDYARRIEPEIEELDSLARRNIEINLCSQITRAMDLKRFSTALLLMDSLSAMTPESPEAERVLAMREEIREKRDDALIVQVIQSLYREVDDLLLKYSESKIPAGNVVSYKVVRTRSGDTFTGILKEDNPEEIVLESDNRTIRIARNQIISIGSRTRADEMRTPTFDESKTYATNRGEGALMDAAFKVADKLGVTEQEVLDIWNARLDEEIHITPSGKKITPARAWSIHEARYGEGTWLRDGFQSPISMTDFGQRRVDPQTGIEVVKKTDPRYETDQEKWWKHLKSRRRYVILKAFAADALFDVTREVKLVCPVCGGKRYVPSTINLMGQEGEMSPTPCYYCRGTGYSIRLFYR